MLRTYQPKAPSEKGAWIQKENVRPQRRKVLSRRRAKGRKRLTH